MPGDKGSGRPASAAHRGTRATLLAGPAFIAILCAAPVIPATPVAPAIEARLVILAETGHVRDGLPVYTRHPDPRRHLDVLTRGFPARLLRVYEYVQHRVSPGAIEPAYLLLSNNEGGFPRRGFWLDDQRKADVAYVDLHRNSTLAGRFGALDQIFPHELMHVILRQLAGPPPPGGGTQVHAVGVTTDRVTAFQEGFAEHAQVMAVDDAEADSLTRALQTSDREWDWAQQRLRAFERSLVTWWPPAPRARIAFLFWFGAMEQTARYHAVKRNLFAFEPPMSDRLLADPHAAYAWRSIAHGDPSRPRKRMEELLATEGVVAALFQRLVTSPFTETRAAPDVYAAFGAAGSALPPVENAYLKIFHAIAAHRVHDALGVLRALAIEFPADAGVVSTVAMDVGIDVARPPAPQIWLANERFVTGTSMYDQHAVLPRVHTFDLNAASLVDLLAIPGVDRTAAESLLHALPLSGLDAPVLAMAASPALRAELTRMAARAQRARADDVEEDVAVGLPEILWSYAWRALAWIAVAAAASAWIISRVRPLSKVRLVANGVAVSATVLVAAWIVEPPAVAPFVPLVLFGLPGASWTLVRHGRRAALRSLASWIAATIPPLVISTPL